MKLWGIAALLACGCALTACSDEEESVLEVETEGLIPGDGNGAAGRIAAYVVAGTVGSESAYVIKSGSLTEGGVSALGNGYETTYASSATWLFFGDKYLYRLAYNQGQAGTTVAFYLGRDGKIHQRTGEYTISNFWSYGIYGNKIITTATGATDTKDGAGNAAYGISFSVIDVDNETVTPKTIMAENFLGNGEYVMLSGLLESNGKIYSAVIPMGCSPYGVAAGAVRPENMDLVKTETGGTGGGTYEANSLPSTQFPDSCYIAVFDDATFENYTIIKTGDMSWAAGRMRSAYYQTIWAADNGDIYVFSPSYAKIQENVKQRTTHPSSVMRIKKGATEFDSTYGTVDIEAAAESAEGTASGAKTRYEGGSGSGSGGHGGSGSGSHGGGSNNVTDNSKAIYRCWHITGDYFLLQMYTQGITFNGSGATKMAVFKGEGKSFRYVRGLPDPDKVESFSVKTPYNEDGVCYIAVKTTDGLTPVLYKVDPATATATPGLTVEIDDLGAIGKLVAQ